MFPRTQVKDGEEGMSDQHNGTPPVWVGVALLVVGGCTLGFCIGAPIGEWRVEQQAIKRGYAEYNATTGKWQWKGDKPEATE